MKFAGQPSRQGKILKWILASFLGLLFVVAALPLVLAHFFKPTVLRVSSDILSDAFEGRLEIDDYESVDWGGVEGADATIATSEGVVVLGIEDLSVELALPGLLWDLVRGSGVLSIDMQRVHARHVNLNLSQTENGDLLLARALTPTPSKPSTNSSGVVRLNAEAVVVEHAWVHGALSPALSFDAQVSPLTGKLHLDEESLDIEGVNLEARIRRFADLTDFRLKTQGGMRLSLDDQEPSNSDGPIPSVFISSHLTLEAEKGDSFVLSEMSQKGQRVDWSLEGKLSESLLSRQIDMVEEDATVRAEIHGAHPRYDGKVTLEHRQGKVQARIEVDQDSNHIELNGDLEIARIDPNWFSQAGPDLSPMNANLNFSLTHRLDDDADPLPFQQASVSGNISSFTAQSRSIPALSLAFDWNAPRFDLKLETGKGQDSTFVRAKGAWNDTDAWPAVRFAGRAELSLLRTFVAELEEGSGTITAQGTLRPGDREIELEVNAGLRDVKVASMLEAQHVDLDLHAAGSWLNPSFDAGGSLERIVLLEGTPQQRFFDSARIEARGHLKEARVRLGLRNDKNELTLRTTLRVGQGLQANDLRLDLDGRGQRLNLSVDGLSFDDQGISARAVEFGGDASGRIDVDYDGQALSMKGSVRNLSLGTLFRLARLDPQISGTLDLDVDGSFSRNSVDGRVRVVVSNAKAELGTASEITMPFPLDLSVDVVGEGSRVDLALSVEKTGKDSQELLAEVFAGVKLPPPDRRSEPKSWIDSLLHLEATTELDLSVVPSDLLPKGIGLEGHVQASIRASQSDSAGERRFRVRLTTSSLSLTYASNSGVETSSEQSDETSGSEQTVKTIRDFDIKLAASLSFERTPQRVRLRVLHGGKLFFSVALRVDAPLLDFASESAWSEFEDTPLRLRFYQPMRALENFPPELGVLALRGGVETTFSLDGSLREPRFEADVRAQRLRSQSQDRAEGMSGAIHLDSRAAHTKLEGSLRGDKAQRITVAAKIDAPWGAEQWQETPASVEEIVRSASGTVELEAFPMQMFEDYFLRGIEGTLSGRLSFEDFGSPDPRASAQVDLSRVTIQGLALENSLLKVELNRDRLAGEVKITGDSFGAKASARADLTWSSPWAFSPKENVTGEAQIDNMPLKLVRPFVRPEVVDLSGRLFVDMKARRASGRTTVAGEARVDDGHVQLPRLGQDIQDAHVEVVWDEDGKVRLKNTSFRGVTGRARVSGEAQMDGIFPESAQVRIRIARNERFPLSLQGLGLGECWGDIETKLDIDRDAQSLKTNTQVHSLHVSFPQIPGRVQDLGEAPNISVGTRISKDEFVELPLQPLQAEETEQSPWTVDAKIDLGDELWLQQGPTRRIQVGGSLNLHVGDEFRPQGKLELSRGRIEINGRMFEVREGTITLQPNEPDNPIVLAQASWTSSEGITVIATFRGPVQSGTMTLSSEPELPQDQVLSLLLFGDTGGLNGAGEGDTDAGAQAAAVGGKLLTEGLNRVLTRIDAIDISTRVTGSGEDNVRPEVVVQLTNSLSVQVGYNLEEPSPGQSPDRTLVTLEVRLSNGHALSGTIGDQGTSLLDWVWRHRY